MTDHLTKRPISHGEARHAISRLVAAQFRTPGQTPEWVGIPGRPDLDDDLVLLVYVAQREAADAPPPAAPEDKVPSLLERVRTRAATLPNCIVEIARGAYDRDVHIVLHDRTSFRLNACDLREGMREGETIEACLERGIYEAVITRQPATATR